MGGIDKSIRKWTPKELRSDPIGKKVDQEVKSTWESMSPEMPAAEAVMPMADEEEIKRNRRRTASARGGGRASTIFTDSDRLGP